MTSQSCDKSNEGTSDIKEKEKKEPMFPFIRDTMDAGKGAMEAGREAGWDALWGTRVLANGLVDFVVECGIDMAASFRGIVQEPLGRTDLMDSCVGAVADPLAMKDSDDDDSAVSRYSFYGV